MYFSNFALLILPEGLAPSLAPVAASNLILRILLSGITMTSAVGKFLDPEGGRQAMGDFGVPSRWVDPFARGLPILELLLSAAVLFDCTTRAACVGLALMFLAFSVGLANLLRQDKAPPCNCFGAVHSEPVSAFTVARALALSVLSIGCLSSPVFPLNPSFKEAGITGLAFVVAGFAVRRLAQRKLERRLAEKRRRLLVGQRIPAVQTSAGEWLAEVLPPDKKTLLLTTVPGCETCQQLKQVMLPWLDVMEEQLAVVELRMALDEDDHQQEGSLVCYRLDPKAHKRFLSFESPGGILVDDSGTILEPPVAGPWQIEALIRLTLDA